MCWMEAEERGRKEKVEEFDGEQKEELRNTFWPSNSFLSPTQQHEKSSYTIALYRNQVQTYVGDILLKIIFVIK